MSLINNKYIFDASDINTDDRPLRRTLHLPVLYSTRVRQFTQNTERSEVEGVACTERSRSVHLQNIWHQRKIKV